MNNKSYWYNFYLYDMIGLNAMCKFEKGIEKTFTELISLVIRQKWFLK